MHEFSIELLNEIKDLCKIIISKVSYRRLQDKGTLQSVSKTLQSTAEYVQACLTRPASKMRFTAQP